MSTSKTALEASAVEITKSMLPDLEQLSKCAEEPVAVVFADSLLRKMRSLHDAHMYGHYTEVVMALHDALAHQNRWINYTSKQYEAAYCLFSSLVNQNTITNADVENAIISLEKMGFNTLPFGTILDDDNYEDSEEV